MTDLSPGAPKPQNSLGSNSKQEQQEHLGSHQGSAASPLAQGALCPPDSWGGHWKQEERRETELGMKDKVKQLLQAGI